MADQSENHDVIIIGGGLAGLTCALALSGPHMSIPFRTLVIDAGPDYAKRDTSRDTRGSAITRGSKNLLEAIGIWNLISDDAQPFEKIIVTDGGKVASSAPVLLNFASGHDDEVRDAWMLENRALLDALITATADCANISIVTDAKVRSCNRTPGHAIVETDSGACFKAPLVVAADGKVSKMRSDAGIELLNWSYKQSAITATVGHELPHHGCAEEHFRANGPFAILPLTGNRFSLVWADEPAEVDRLMGLSLNSFSEELQQRVGTHLGALTVLNKPAAWPLGLQIAKQFTSDRLCLLGDSAHVIHPIAGLGFNLALKDIAALAECLADSMRRGLDIGGTATLEQYESWRRADTIAVAAMCDGLAKLFSNDITAMKIIRGAGLQLVDRVPPLKQFFADNAAGTSGRQPVLMSGVAL